MWLGGDAEFMFEVVEAPVEELVGFGAVVDTGVGGELVLDSFDLVAEVVVDGLSVAGPGCLGAGDGVGELVGLMTGGSPFPPGQGGYSARQRAR